MVSAAPSLWMKFGASLGRQVSSGVGVRGSGVRPSLAPALGISLAEIARPARSPWTLTGASSAASGTRPAPRITPGRKARPASWWAQASLFPGQSRANARMKVSTGTPSMETIRAPSSGAPSSLAAVTNRPS